MLNIFSISQKFHTKTSQRLKALHSESYPNVWKHFDEMKSGITSIRTFGAQKYFTEEYYKKMDLQTDIDYCMSTSGRYFRVFTTLLNALIIFLVSILIILKRDQLSVLTVAFV